MKFLILSLALVAVSSAQHYGNNRPVVRQIGQQVLHAAVNQVSSGKSQQPIAILRQSQDVSPDGAYSFNYEAENGISASESGSLGPVNEKGEAAIVSQGQFQYIAPDGTPITVTYTADQNGFQPQGAHLPVPPAIPPQIQRALDFIASHPRKTNQPQQVFQPI